MMSQPILSVRDLTVGYDNRIVLQSVNFDVMPGDIFVIMGGSGCGKSTLLKHLIGLKTPLSGTVYHEGEDFFKKSDKARQSLQRQFGVLYQGSALWSSLTLIENVSLPLEELTDLSPEIIYIIARYKLALVGLRGFEHFYPSELSGGMRKRAALARAMALDPKLLFFDEPSAGLDPITSRRLDDLILELKQTLGSTIILVTHELASIFSIGTQAIFLDGPSQSLIAQGTPKDLLHHNKDSRVQAFLKARN